MDPDSFLFRFPVNVLKSLRGLRGVVLAPGTPLRRRAHLRGAFAGALTGAESFLDLSLDILIPFFLVVDLREPDREVTRAVRISGLPALADIKDL